MKLFLTLLFAQLLFTCHLFAGTFTINGKVTGAETFNYAYLFNSRQELQSEAKIAGGAYSFKGETNKQQQFGELPYGTILLSKTILSKEEIVGKGLLSESNPNICRVILEENINLLYNTDRKTFSIKGGQLNEVQNLFENALANFKNKRDSVYLAIDQSDATKKEEKKSLATEKLFTETRYRFMQIVKKDSAAKEVLAFNLLTPAIRESAFGQHIYQGVADKIRYEERMGKPNYIDTNLQSASF